jgi:hypothetical protein
MLGIGRTIVNIFMYFWFDIVVYIVNRLPIMPHKKYIIPLRMKC